MYICRVNDLIMQVSVSRKAHFNAAHRLHLAHWSDEQNKAYFGLCNNANYHGHNYEVIVTVSGNVNAETGYLMDMKELKQYIFEEVEERFDHRNLNEDTIEFKTLNPTAENIAIVIWQLLRKRISNELKLKITLFETERNFVEYAGNE